MDLESDVFLLSSYPDQFRLCMVAEYTDLIMYMYVKKKKKKKLRERERETLFYFDYIQEK